MHMTFHADVWAMEQISEADDVRWNRFVAACERAIGTDDLDGCEWVEGFSLDSARDAYKAGITPVQYAEGRRG